jgi:hypothetical protein
MQLKFVINFLILFVVCISGCISQDSTNKNVTNSTNITHDVKQVHTTNALQPIKNEINISSSEINESDNSTLKYGNNTNLATIKAWRDAHNKGSGSLGSSTHSSSSDSSEDTVSDSEESGMSVDATSSDDTDATDQNSSDEINIDPDT